MKIKNIFALILGVGISLLPFFASAGNTRSPEIKIYNQGLDSITNTFQVYEDSFKNGQYLSSGDINNDKTVEIITGPGKENGSQVRIFNNQAQNLGSFLAFGEKFMGGSAVATGDIDGDGKKEIITAAGPGGGPQVRVFNQAGQPIMQFFAFVMQFRGGINIASGDIDGDGKDEIICGAGPGGGPQVQVFNSAGQVIWQMFPFHPDFRGGVDVSASDTDGDGKDEIIVSQLSGGQAWVKVYKVNHEKTVLANFLAYPESFEGGSRISTGNVAGNKDPEIVTGAGPGGGPQVRIFDKNGNWIGKQGFVFENDYHGGVEVDVNKKDHTIIVSPRPKSNEKMKCKNNCVALTIDDGYSQEGSIESILDTLKRRNVKATFFLLGSVMQSRPDLMRKIVNEGHQLANHSYIHPSFTAISADRMRSEIINTDNIAKSITGESTKPYFRYPKGERNSYTDSIINGIGYKHIHWTADPFSLTGGKETPESVVYHSVNNLKHGSVLLIHSFSKSGAVALDTIITEVEKRGYQFARVDEMFTD